MIKTALFLSISFALLYSNDYMFEEGKVIYETTCVSCHGTDGKTNPEMALIVRPRQLNKTILSSEQSFQVIKEGAHFWGAHSDIMPTFKYVYKDDEIETVTHYISKKFNSNRDERVSKLLEESDVISDADKSKMMKTGKKIFNRNCSMCHGLTGNGQSDYVEQSKEQANFIFPYDLRRTLLSEDQIFLYAKFGGKYWGTMENDMPSWSRKYNDFKLKSVAKYVNEKIKQIRE